MSFSVKPGMSADDTCSREPSCTSHAMTGARRQKFGPRSARSRVTRRSAGATDCPEGIAKVRVSVKVTE